MHATETYKRSRFNVVFEESGRSYLWNTLSGALIGLDSEGLAYMESGSEVRRCDRFFQPLYENGFVVDSRCDEVAKVVAEERAAMLEPYPRILTYTIAPGMGCNYRCAYCFEDGVHRTSQMDAATQDEVVRFILESASANGNLEAMRVRWFGGEPLLYLPAISRISEALIGYCDERGILYSAEIVTNGRMLTREAAEELARLRVGHAQVSIDGMPERYARLKGATRHDFEATVENIAASCDLLRVAVRINVSDDLADAAALTDHLLREKGLDGRIGVYVAHIRDYGGEAPPQVEADSHGRFLELAKRYEGMFGEGAPYSLESLFVPEPKRRCASCPSVCSVNFCIGPSGALYRCEHHFCVPGREVGTVRDGRFYPAHEAKLSGYDHPLECRECSFLPICMGGCRYDALERGRILDCDGLRRRFVDMMTKMSKRQGLI